MNTLSELEGVVLGLVSLRQPCTAYGVRRALTDSPSTHWSASSGSIYPLLRKLESRGLVESSEDPDDRRGRRLLQVTDAGRAVHSDWMFQASSPAVTAAVSDTIRSRAFFLGSLAPAERVRFIEEALAALDVFLARTRDDLEARERSEDTYGTWAARGGVYQAEARVRWMLELKREVERESSGA
ncbi:MAG: PadR family transcriptional regulator [Gemmatimonadota bacterium]